jgi:drug/metabolite transporter (DMT)-like permease
MSAVILLGGTARDLELPARRAGGSRTVAALGIVAESLLLLPLAIAVLISSGGVPAAQFVPAIVVAALLALANYAALMAAYRRADLSLAYPVARGGVFLFLPLLGFIVFGERLDARGWLALAMIVTGIMLLPLTRFDRPALGELGRHLRDRTMGFALLAAAATAGYTVWDKYAIGFLDTFLYFSGYTVLLGLWFAVRLTRVPRDEVREQVRKHAGAILVIGVLIAASYLLVLIALRDGVSTQVLAVRQLSIPIGVLLGWRLLRESLSPPRLIGSTLITAGCVLAAFI